MQYAFLHLNCLSRCDVKFCAFLNLGASSGIGEAAAVDFAKQGAKVVLTGRNKERLSAAAKRCTDEGAEVNLIVEYP